MEGEITKVMPHTLTLDQRKRARLAGVVAVSCFHDQEVVLETSEGELAILGENLHIEELSLEDGRLDVTGTISGVEYADKKERRGLFMRRRR